MDNIVQAVVDAIENAGLIQVEVSARHAHLSQTDLEALFGRGAALTPKRELSQPGQYLSEERIAIIGPKGKKERLAILGPVRTETQVELSKSDCVDLGIDAPVRESGDLADSSGIILEGPNGRLHIGSGAIIAQNHIHMQPELAGKLGLENKQHVKVQVFTDRPLIFGDVIVRVSDKFRNYMHIDFDEANAAGMQGFTLGKIMP